jgi:hypothetical protein
VHEIHDRVLRFLHEPTADDFAALALAVFAHQIECIEPYRAFCRQRGVDAASVTDWRRIPPVPVAAFKHVELRCGPVEREFRSTGTTAGPQHRSRHLMPDLRLYRTSAGLGLRSFLFPDVERMPILSLIDSVVSRPDSSLAQMAAWAIEDFGAPESCSAMGELAARVDALVEFLRGSERTGEPCAILTTTGTLVRVLDRLKEKALTFRLPHGSRLMDTGGDKGSPRPVSRRGLLHACWSAFAIPGYFCVNEYGMAELSSQFYDNVIAFRRAGRFAPRYKIGPAWTRTLVLDPASLTPAAPGERGLLCHVDLANVGSAVAVLTEDIGVAVADGFELAGRAAGAELRGCSLTAAEWETR